MSALSAERNNRAFLPVPSFPDPNAQQNRVPSNTELATLRRISESNAKVTRMFDEEIEQLRETYEAIHRRYLQQQIELEATQSELHRVRSLISATEAQRALRESEQRDLLALMHPVRRCPDDILREIFEYTAHSIKERTLALRKSVHLSSVCQKWRTVAIDTPLLWKKIHFDLRHAPEVLKHQQQTVVSRIKGRAADIHVAPIYHLSRERLDACGLQMFPFIDTLLLTIVKLDGILQLLRPEFIFPADHVRTVFIQSKGVPNTAPQSITLGSNLLNQFPGLKVAIVNSLSNVTFQLASINSTLTQLTIDKARVVSIATIFSGCPKLDALIIRNTSILGSPTPVVAASISYLELTSIEGHAWMASTSLPKLDTLVLCTDTTAAILAFISSNRSITNLFCRNSPSDIVNIAPQLIELHALPPLQALCSTPNSTQVSLPSLKHLFVNTTPLNHSFTLQEFDTLVRERCLPLGHPQSLAKQSSQTLSSLTFLLPDNPQPQAWQQSELYKESTREEFSHPFYDRKVLDLTWTVDDA